MKICLSNTDYFDKTMIIDTLKKGIEVCVIFPDNNVLCIRRSNEIHFLMKEPVDLYEIIDGEFDPEQTDENEKFYFGSNGEYWPIDFIENAVDVFIERVHSETPFRWSGKGYKPSEILVYNTKKVYFSNHYEYLDKILDPFWLEVFGKTSSEMMYGGIISAHGDKCSGYNFEWDENGINHNRGSLLFLLTYTKEFGDNKKHMSGQWVIDNYQKYLPMIEKAESIVLENILTGVN